MHSMLVMSLAHSFSMSFQCTHLFLSFSFSLSLPGFRFECSLLPGETPARAEVSLRRGDR